MRTSALVHTPRYETSARIHIIVLYLLLASLTISWASYAIYLSRTIRAHTKELILLQQRLGELEETQITITSLIDEDNAVQRRSRHTHRKSKVSGKARDEEADSVIGAIRFKVPVRWKISVESSVYD